MNRPPRLCLLAVLAHPDDESFGPGGTLALYAMRGVAVHLVCATRGEVGSAPAELMAGHASLADLRESELRCAAGHLGLASVTFLDYRDSGMPGSEDNRHPRALAAARVDEVGSRVAHLLRQLRPQVVITADPMGGYGHPDHIAVNRATLRAFELAAGPSQDFGGLPAYAPQKLYYHTFHRGALRFLVSVLPLMGRDPRHWGQNNDIDLTAIAAVDYPIHARIDVRQAALAKQRASACHASQGGGAGGRISRWSLRLLSGRETFMRARPPADRKLRERDLFEGVEPD